MDKERILKIAEELSQNTIMCAVEYTNPLSVINGTELVGNNITVAQLKKFFKECQVGTKCVIKKIVFQPKDKEFLVFIIDGKVACNKYVDKEEAEEVIDAANKILNIKKEGQM